MKPEVSVVFVGHIDHGKSTLIGRLLYDTGSFNADKIAEIKQVSKDLNKDMEFAFFLDHFDEERSQGITIDTVQTQFDSDKYNYQIIDAPGHKEFLKNMMTGASNAEAAVILVSAKPGEDIQEQTRRHAYLCHMIGIQQFFVVINKLDTVDYSQEKFESMKKEVEEIFIGFGIQKDNMQFIPVSAKEGDNVYNKSDKTPWYNGPTVLELLDSNLKPTKKPIEYPMTFLVQDIFDFDDEKLVMGKVESGTLTTGDTVIFQPNGTEVQIEKIKVFEGEREKAIAGESVGLKIKDSLKDPERGNVAIKGDIAKASDSFIGKIISLSGNDIDLTQKLFVRVGTAETECELEVLENIDTSTGSKMEESTILKPADGAILKIKTANKLTLQKFSELPYIGRFVLINEDGIIAAGIVEEIM